MRLPTYLSGNFAPIQQESTIENLDAIGEIPPELEGMLVRNGPNPQFPPIGQYHWFDGDGMVHSIQLKAVQAMYRNRYVKTLGHQKEHAAQQAIWSGLLEPPQMYIPEGSSKNTANTALAWHAGKFLATWEGGEPHTLTLPALETLGKQTFQDQLTSPMTAHPKVDPQTGEMFFFGYSFAPPFLQYGVVSTVGEVVQIQPIEKPVGTMMHDFAITENYAIFPDFPLTFRPERMAQGKPGLAFEPETPTRFGIMPRHGNAAEIRWFEAASCYGFHILNAYEDGDEIVLFACRMGEFDLTGTGDPQNSIPFLWKWRFNLQSNTVTDSQVAPHPCEFPQVNPAYVGRPMKFSYAGRMPQNPMPLFDAVLKFDFSVNASQPTVTCHELGENRYCSEIVFAARPNATAEDDGWLLNFVHDENTNQSECLILAAQDIAAEPVARIIIPQRVPYGFHALWVSAAQIAQTLS